MSRAAVRLDVVTMVLLASTFGVAHAQSRPAEPTTTPRAGPIALWDGLGAHHHRITTRVPEAQRFFDQGLRLVYAFDHPDALRSFRRAQALDPSCAMCQWGEALALGPNINQLMDSAAAVAAHAAVTRAVELARAPHAAITPRERAYIDALAVRYGADPRDERKRRDSAYAQAMRRLHHAAPRDDDAAVLYAEAEMLLGPWDYWAPGRVAKPHGAAAIAALAPVVRRSPDHAGACHFYIHAVEAAFPERAVPCAERLPSLMPAAGHVVHMPGHIYIRVGRYADAIERNVHALHADDMHLAEMPSDGVYRLALHPHNAHFLAFAASMIGRSAQAMDAARGTRERVDTSMLRAPGLGALQHYVMVPELTMVRFQQWDAILATAAPPTDLPYMQGLHHYARALALAAKGDLDGATREYDALRTARADRRLESVTLWDINGGAALLAVADATVVATLADARGDTSAAVAALEAAVRLEDALTYDEPPPWHLPVRQQLGAVLLRAGRAREAEATFRADLERHPANGWSLAGLAASLRAQRGRTADAIRTEAQLARVWRSADIPIPRYTR